MAARLPLDDSDDGDSLISGSTNTGSLSRNNSTGDVRKVSPEVQLRQTVNDVRIIIIPLQFALKFPSRRPVKLPVHPDQVLRQVAEQALDKIQAMI